jgi:hypothetical protein
MPLQIHPYFRDKEKAMEACLMIPARNSLGYTVQAAAESAGTQPQPNLLDGSNWFFGGQIPYGAGQTHNS